MKNLTLTRPLAIVDLETTGLNPSECRIVEVSVLRLPDGVHRTRRVNPGIPIPPEATAIHGITDADVRRRPAFSEIAHGLLDFLAGCDLAGFNLKRFDLKVLSAEFARCDLELDLAGRAIIDVCEIFHKREPRDLEGAVQFFLGRNHNQAHSGEADVLATAEVLEEMIERYELPRSSDQLAAAFVDPNAVDLEGFFARRDGAIVFAKGKYAGKPIAHDLSYLQWMLGGSFLPDTKRIVREALEPQGVK